jgi:hypothetical protein
MNLGAAVMNQLTLDIESVAQQTGAKEAMLLGVGEYKIEYLGPLPRPPASFRDLAMDDDIRQRIINSLFSKRGPSGVVEEQYISHCKIFEDAGLNQTTGLDEAGRKARYILLSRMSCSLLIRLPAIDHTQQSLALAQRGFTSQRRILMARSQSVRRGIWKTFAALRSLVYVSSSTIAIPATRSLIYHRILASTLRSNGCIGGRRRIQRNRRLF